MAYSKFHGMTIIFSGSSPKWYRPTPLESDGRDFAKDFEDGMIALFQ